MTNRTLQSIPLRSITCARQVREVFDEEAIAELTQSLRTVGLQQPILVRREGDRYVVVDGERRYRAAVLAGWESIQALVEEGEPGEPERIVRQLVANCQREDLTPIEMAKAIHGLMAASGCTASEAAARIGLKPSRVSKLLALLALPEEVQEEVHAGRLAASTAYEIAKVKNSEEQAALIADAAEGGLKRDVAAKRGRSAKRSGAASGKRASPARRKRKTTVTVAPGCAVALTGSDIDVASLLGVLEDACARLRTRVDAGALDVASVVALLRGDAPGEAVPGDASTRPAGEGR